MKRTLSLLLSLLIVCSLFSGLSFSATATTTERIDALPLEPDALTADDPQAEGVDLMRDKDSELAETGANADLAATGHYNIAVGPNTVTDGNKNDILGDGGSAKYNPSTKTLTLNNPTINSVYNNDTNYGAIHIQASGVTVKGTYHMTRSLSKYGLYMSEGNSVTLDGNFTFFGTHYGIVSNNNITVKSGTLRAVCTGKSDGDYAVLCACPYEEDEAGYSPATFTIQSGVTKVTMESNTEAFYGDDLVMNSQRITSPVDASFVDTAYGIVLADLTGYAKSVTIEPFSGTYYNLWVGARHVDSQNYNNIFGDGKASYNSKLPLSF